jgi:molybdate transport system substrate-binding protein
MLHKTLRESTLTVRLMIRAVFAGFLLPGCGGSNSAGEGGARLTVFAAASTAEVVTQLADFYEGAGVKTSFGASSGLARQIQDGAPADLYISASKKWIDFLKEIDALHGEPMVFARNALVCVAPRDSKLQAESAGALVQRLSGNDKVAIANEGVPAGDYARQSLNATGDLGALKPWMVGQKDVRAVLYAVEKGECAAGFVYATDARVANVRVRFTFPPDTHEPIEYYAAVMRGSAKADEARRFLEYLGGDAAHAALEQAGFVLP